MGNQLVNPSLAPLVSARTVHLDASAGSDATGDGSSTRPWQTLAEAWADRLTYGELRAAYTVQLHGVGPYTLPVMGTSTCGFGGFFIIQGDSTVDSVAVTSTFTGDMTGFTIPATAGLGVDTHKGKFLWITSGTCAGTRATILSHTDTVITLALSDFRTAASGAIVAGDTFQIRVPGSVINCPTPASGVPFSGGYNWVGGTTTANNPPIAHLFVNVFFTGSLLKFQTSDVCFLGVTSTCSGIQVFETKLRIGGVPNGSFLGIGANSNTSLLSGYGLSVTAGSFSGASNSQMYILGMYCTIPFFIGSASMSDVCVWGGGRLDGTMLINGRFETQGSYNTQISKTLASQSGQILLNAGTWTFAVTAGQCLLAQRNAMILITTGVTLSGSTTDAASVAMNAISGSKIILVNRAPTLTGVGGADIKAESTAAIANASLSANGQGTVDAVTLAAVMRVAA